MPPVTEPNPISVKAVWADFLAYLRRPALIRPAGLRAPGTLRLWATMLALHIAGLALLIPLLSAWQTLTGVSGPDAFDQFPKQYLLVTVVAIAPPLEEMFFRGWLTGRPRALWLLACAAALAAAAIALPDRPELLGIGVLALLLLAISGWVALRRRPAADWAARHFPALFYASVACFGAMHVFNYPHPGLLVLPMVLPQLWAGLTLGYLRMRIGLPASILAHASANGFAMALTMLGV